MKNLLKSAFKSKSASFEGAVIRLVLLLLVPFFSIFVLMLYQLPWHYAAKCLVFLLALFFVGVLLFKLRYKLERQLRSVSTIIESAMAGDPSLRAKTTFNQGALAELYRQSNDVASNIARHRQQIQQRQRLLEVVMATIPSGILLTNEAGVILQANEPSKRIFNNETLEGGNISAYAIDLDGHDQEQLVKLSTDAHLQHVTVQLKSVMLEHSPHWIVFVHDVDQLIKTQERASFNKLLRVLSHEINNSLAPISALTQSFLHQINKGITLGDEYKIGLEVINERSNNLATFVKGYNQLGHLGKPQKALHSLNSLILDAAQPFTTLTVENSNDDIQAYVDATQFKQVLINVFKNGLEAMADQELPKVVVHSNYQQGWLTLTVTDSGCGIANPDNLFVPYFTTKEQGAGVGLVLCQHILFAHGGHIHLENRPEGTGAVVKLQIPMRLT